MSRPEEPPVGERIREERTKRGVSLRGLARDVGVSASLISQIETGKCRPSVSTLYALTTALGVSIENVFESPAADHSGLVAVTASSPAPALAPLANLAVLAGRDAGPLTRPGAREVLELDSGVTWERLGHVPGIHVDFLRVTYPPGGSSSAVGELMRHSGAEYGYLMEGELILTLGTAEHRLMAGDSVSFPSSTPHRYRNDAPRPAVGIWFVAE
ncbi:MAG: cupin domain-containing protein [Micromonosporaceae bacterium]